MKTNYWRGLKRIGIYTIMGHNVYNHYTHTQKFLKNFLVGTYKKKKSKYRNRWWVDNWELIFTRKIYQCFPIYQKKKHKRSTYKVFLLRCSPVLLFLGINLLIYKKLSSLVYLNVFIVDGKLNFLHNKSITKRSEYIVLL